MADKVCNIPKVTLEQGSCDVKNRCCRNCWQRRTCDVICRLCFSPECEYRKKVKE